MISGRKSLGILLRGPRDPSWSARRSRGSSPPKCVTASTCRRRSPGNVPRPPRGVQLHREVRGHLLRLRHGPERFPVRRRAGRPLLLGPLRPRSSPASISTRTARAFTTSGSSRSAACTTSRRRSPGGTRTWASAAALRAGTSSRKGRRPRVPRVRLEYRFQQARRPAPRGQGQLQLLFPSHGPATPSAAFPSTTLRTSTSSPISAC